jgi:DNA-binding MarR family transcriptional regulator
MSTMIGVYGYLVAIEARLRPLARSHGFRVEDLALMALLKRNTMNTAHMSGALLADRLGRSRQNLQVTLKRLEARGLVEGCRDDSDHVYKWVISDRGLMRWANLYETLTKIDAAVFPTLEGRRAMLRFLADTLGSVRRATCGVFPSRSDVLEPTLDLHDLLG